MTYKLLAVLLLAAVGATSAFAYDNDHRDVVVVHRHNTMQMHHSRQRAHNNRPVQVYHGDQHRDTVIVH